MSEITAVEIRCKGITSVRNGAVSFFTELDTGELLTGTPTITEVNTTDLTITNKSINTSALTINDESVAIGKAVQFSVSGGVAGRTYKIRISAGTDATPAQTIVGLIKLKTLAEA